MSINKFASLVYIPMPGVKASYNNWATPHQWTPGPSVAGDQNGFAVECIRHTHAVAGDWATPCIITDQNKTDFTRMTTSITGQADGWEYHWDGGDLVIPGFEGQVALGALSGPTGIGGDSSGFAAGYLWLPGPASIPLNSFCAEALYAAQQMNATHEYAMTNKPLAAYVIDARVQLAKWWGNGAPQSWFPRLTAVLNQFATIGVPLWLITPPWTNSQSHNEFVGYFVASLGDRFTIVCEQADLCDAAPTKYNLVPANEANAHSAATALKSSAFNGLNVMLDAKQDTLLVLDTFQTEGVFV